MAPTTRELEWAAGFLDGEGTFGRTGRKGQIKGTTERICARQKDPELLHKLERLFGGNVRLVTYRTNSFVGTKYESLGRPIWSWEITGPAARGIMMTLFTLLSQRRRIQIKNALQPSVPSVS